jgi:ferritin-like metal-binding protein YciE
MAELNTLRDLLIHELSDLHNAEKQIIGALPKLIKAAHSPKLRQAFEDHLAVTQKHVTRLEQCFAALGAKPSGAVCPAMKGILAEGAELLKKQGTADPQVFDAALVCSAQRVEHYEMAAYGCVRAFCDTLGEKRVGKLLQETLYEEGEADKLLTILAVSDLNLAAPKRKAAKPGKGGKSGGGKNAKAAKSGKAAKAAGAKTAAARPAMKAAGAKTAAVKPATKAAASKAAPKAATKPMARTSATRAGAARTAPAKAPAARSMSAGSAGKTR